METEKCHAKGCSGEIFFAKNAKGRMVPVDAQPFPREVIPEERRLYLTLRAGHAPKVDGEQPSLAATPEVYVNHHAVCPAVVPERERRLLVPALVERIEQYGQRR